MEPISILLSLAQFAPQLIKWATGNDTAEEVAKVAVDVAQTVAGTKTPAAAVAKFALDPALAAEFAEKLSAREADLDKAYLADLDSARRMQVAALQQDDLFSKRFIYVFSAAWSAFAMLYMLWVTFGTVRNENLANIIIGFLLGTAVSSIFAFFYGSTKKSQDRSDNLYKTLTKG